MSWRPRHKFNAVRTERDGRKFDSKMEARYYDALKLREKAGEILFFFMQVPIPLPGNRKMVIDFQEFHADGTVHHVDVKGHPTPVYKLKKQQVETLYPFKIEEVRKV